MCLPEEFGVIQIREICESMSLRPVDSRSCGALCLCEFRLDFHGTLDMVLQRRPAILHTTTIRCATRQLHQILIEPLLLHLLQFFLPLLCSRSALQALTLYLGLACLDCTVCANIIERIGQ
jgi:hypothetical protein